MTNILSSSSFAFGLNNNERIFSSESIKSVTSQRSELHYTVKSENGRKDIYSKPSLRLKPPELPPRNTPRPSIIEADRN